MPAIVSPAVPIEHERAENELMDCVTVLIRAGELVMEIVASRSKKTLVER